MVGTSTSAAHRLDELGLGHRLVLEVETRVKQLAHTRFDQFRQSPRDHHKGFFLGHERRSYRPRGAAAAPAAAIIRFRAFRPVHAALTTDDANGYAGAPTDLTASSAASLAEERAKTRMAGYPSRTSA